MRPARLAFSILSTVAGLTAQVPDGYFVWGSFQGTAGVNGIFFSHPRDPMQPFVAVTSLPPALGYDPSGKRGAACVAYRKSDGALIAGERAPSGTSVDLHVLKLNGADVVFAQLFSVGTSANVGEIPQCAILPDGRVLLAATDLAAGGPLSQFLTTSYNWEGVGILDTNSGGVVAVPISNLNQFPGVINGIAASKEGTTAYIANYVSATSGDLWSVPIPAGGQATKVATFPCGASNVAVDIDGTVLVTALNGPPNLFRYDPVANTTAAITTSSGALNAIAVETVTGGYVLATANAGTPVRSLVLLTRTGGETVLVSPNRATIAGIDVNPNPEAFGASSPGAGRYDWRLTPNPGGLPLVGNAGFSLTIEATTISPSMLVLASRRLATPITIAGVQIHTDLGSIVFSPILQAGPSMTLPLPIPANTVLVGLPLYAQTFHLEGGASLAASAGLEFTIL